MKTAIGIDIGGTKISVSKVSAAGKILRHDLVLTPKTKVAVLETLYTLLDDYLTQDKTILGIGVGIPGRVKDGVIIHIPNLPFLKGLPLKNLLAKRYRRPVAIANDAGCFILAEHVFGAAKGHGTVCGITVGTGLGCGIIVNDQLLGGNAGEISHIRFKGRPLETYVSGKYMMQRYAQLSRKHVDRTFIVKEGDAHARRIMEQTYDVLASTCIGVARVIGCSRIVIGGGVGRALSIAKLNAAIKQKKLFEAPVRAVRQGCSHPSSLGAACLLDGFVR